MDADRMLGAPPVDIPPPPPIVGQAGAQALGIGNAGTGIVPRSGALGFKPQMMGNVQQDMDKKNAEVNAQISAKEAERDAAVKGANDQRTATGNELSGILQKGAEHKDLPPLPKFTPTDIQQNMGWLMALAAFSGMASRQPLTASMNAMAGMIEGVNRGDEARFQKEFKIYDENLKGVIEKNRQYEKEFDRIVKSKELSISQQSEQLRLLNLQYDRQVQRVADQKTDYKNSMDMGFKAIQANNKAQENLLRIQEMALRRQEMQQRAQQAHEDRMAAQEGKGWQVFQKPDGTLVRVNAATGESAPMEGTAGLVKPKAGGTGAGGKALTAMQATMYTDVATGYFRLGELKKIYDETGEIPAGSAFLQSQMHADGLVSVLRNYAVNGVMPEGLQKNDALLLGVAFDVASARSGGRGQLSDAKIREVTRQMPVAGDSESTKAEKYKIIVNQLQEANNTLPEGHRYKPGGEDEAPTGWTDDKEKRYQELKAKQNAAQ